MKTPNTELLVYSYHSPIQNKQTNTIKLELLGEVVVQDLGLGKYEMSLEIKRS